MTSRRTIIIATAWEMASNATHPLHSGSLMPRSLRLRTVQSSKAKSKS